MRAAVNNLGTSLGSTSTAIAPLQHCATSETNPWLSLPRHTKRCLHNRQRCLKVCAAAEADLQPLPPAAEPVREPFIQLTKQKRKLSWQQWERKLLEQLEKADQEQVCMSVWPVTLVNAVMCTSHAMCMRGATLGCSACHK